MVGVVVVERECSPTRPGCCIHLSPYKANDDTQVWEKIDVPDTIKFYLHQKWVIYLRILFDLEKDPW